MKKILLSSALFTLFAGVQAQISFTNDIYPGGDADPYGLQELNGKLYFSADDGVNGRELWKYDPATNTSQMVFNIGPGSANGLGYNADDNNYYSYIFNGKLYFTASDQTIGAELWVYDGINPPSIVADIFPGATGSVPYNYISLNNKLYFSANSPTVGIELFVYDPITNIAQAVSNINPGIQNSDPGNKMLFGNKIYFSAYEPTTGRELYIYNPTSNITSLVSDIESGAASSNPSPMIEANGKIYFSAITGAFGRELYSYSGTGASTRITDLAPGAANGVDPIDPIILFNGKIYFPGKDASLGFELFALDIVTNSTQIAYDINPGNSNSFPLSFCIYSGKLFFRAGGSLGYELYSFDGVTATLVEDLNPAAGNSVPYALKVMANRLYFNATNATSGFELFYYQDPFFSITEYNSNVNTVAYPVPASDEVRIRVTLDETAAFMVNVYDIAGKTVYTLPTTDYMMGTAEINIPLQTLAKGNYQYALMGNKGVMGTGKIIKQ